MPTDNLKEMGLPQFAAGAAGALVSMRFISGTWFEKVTMALGGSALSFFGTPPLSNWLAVNNAEGLLGFLVGLFGMALVSKIYEVIWLIDASRVAKDVWVMAGDPPVPVGPQFRPWGVYRYVGYTSARALSGGYLLIATENPPTVGANSNNTLRLLATRPGL